MKRNRAENTAAAQTGRAFIGSRLWDTRGGNRVLVGGLLGLTLLLAQLHRLGVPLTGWLPPCPFHLLTGFNCPGCGTTRMLESLVSGEVAGAFFLNPFIFLLMAAAVVFLIWFFFRTFSKSWHPLRIDWKSPFWLVLLIAFLLFGVVRNTPWYQIYFY